jgi:hypothetical protein
VTNTSATVVATNVSADLTGTALHGNVTLTAHTCAGSLTPGSNCTLTFAPGATAVPPTSFPIQGDNTNTVNASITVITLTPGTPYAGGIVYESSGGTGKVAAIPTGTLVPWGTAGITIGVASTTDGATNTAMIVSSLGAGTYAAALCSAYEVDSAGNTPCQAGNTCYSDWYLPAIDELVALYHQRAAVGGFNPSGNVYWSSTENGFAPASIAQGVSFSTGAVSSGLKSLVGQFRCIRQF